MAACTNQTIQLSFQKGILEISSSCSSLFICQLSFSKSFTKLVQLLSDATSFFPSVNKHRLNFSLSVILISLHPTNHLAASAKHQKLVTKRSKILESFSIALHLFFWGLLCTTEWAVSCSFCEETCYSVQISGVWKNFRQKVTYRTLYHGSLRKTFVSFTCSFHEVLHYFEICV